MARTDLNSKKENGGRWGKNLVTVLFYSGGGNTVNTQKALSQLPIAEKIGFSETFLFSKITFWKKKTLTSLDNYSTPLPSTRDYIPG